MEHVVIHDPDNGIPDETHVWRWGKGSGTVCADKRGVSVSGGGDLHWVLLDPVFAKCAEPTSLVAIAYRKHLELRDG